MKINTYSENALITNLYPAEHPLIGISGIISELGEFTEAKGTTARKFELGDTFWYCNHLAVKGLESNFKELIEEAYTLEPRILEYESELLSLNKMLVLASKMEGRYKKIIRGDNTSGLKEQLKNHFLIFLKALLDYIEIWGYSLEEILSLNIEKLTKRKETNKIKGDGDYR